MNAAWTLVRKVSAQGLQVADDSISAEDFNSFFIESVSEARNNIPPPSTSSEDFLHRAKRPSSLFEWEIVTSENVISVVSKMKASIPKM
ncbi:hypothetical protein J6590_106741 [Homalodisca vitripennis]|nr:hypothetical protein J6590_106741 [Homalodisca vitripennis]